MRKNTKHQKVESFIKILRESFHDSVMVYRYGGCYGFYQILKSVFPEAKAYFDDSEKNHIVVKIGDFFYDIKGKDPVDDDNILLTKTDHEQCSKWAYGQRLEFMLAKHNSGVLKRSKAE